MRTTTFKAYAGTGPGNYCTLPTRDVVVLPPVPHCEECGVVLAYVRDEVTFGHWEHANRVLRTHDHYVSPRATCRYCHSENVTYVQYAWHNATECARCGGVQGFALGD